MKNECNKELDQEWVQLMKQAMEMGLTKQEIKRFLLKKKTNWASPPRNFILRKDYPFFLLLDKYYAKVY
ncbi:anti-repressor SinI family protein [Alkalihalobacterium alkalinitrilicum]|uniref:anti-repressor SinI family protein n=1 Tax=Alkalihalobacterium alkalinitrilicum TaxID=427920 RepID=UPI000994E59D|nr:anti-repressor SinI family protein [Alkalihalobacterium alkalinitrilicum]